MADFSNSKKSSEALKKFLYTNLGLPKQNVLIDWKHSPLSAQTKVDLSNLEKAPDLFDRLSFGVASAFVSGSILICDISSGFFRHMRIYSLLIPINRTITVSGWRSFILVTKQAEGYYQRVFNRTLKRFWRDINGRDCGLFGINVL